MSLIVVLRSSHRSKLTSDTEEIDQKLGKLRETAQKMQANQILDHHTHPASAWGRLRVQRISYTRANRR